MENLQQGGRSRGDGAAGGKTGPESHAGLPQGPATFA
jgi:hypothetical protein